MRTATRLAISGSVLREKRSAEESAPTGPRPTGAAALVAAAGVASLVVALAAAPAQAADPPPQGSLMGVGAQLAQVMGKVREAAPALEIQASLLERSSVCDVAAAALEACGARDPGSRPGSAAPSSTRAAGPASAVASGPASAAAPPEGASVPASLAPCRAALIALYGEMRAAHDQGDSLRRATAARLATDVADVVVRLGEVERSSRDPGSCDASAPREHAAQVLVSADGGMLQIKPLVALRPGRRYALVVDGLDATGLRIAQRSVVPRPDPEGVVIPPGSLAKPLETFQAAHPSAVDAAKTSAMLRHLESSAAGLPGVSGVSGVQIALAEPLTPERLASLRARFVPAHAAVNAPVVVVVRTIDARAGLLAYRRRIADLGCDESPPETLDAAQVLGGAPSHVRAIVHGRYRSLAIGGDTGATRTLGVPAADARVVELPYLLVLPEKLDPSLPLVLGVDGHMGRAERTVRKQGEALAARGMALLAIDLPAHGERKDANGTPFLDLLDPTSLARNLRQSATDVMAAVQAVRRCGLPVPGAERLRPREIAYLGYSLGGMVGVIARSVERNLGPMALIAPGGDLAGWLMLQITVNLGGGYVTCLGGPEHGASCFPSGRCAPPGVCAIDPYLQRLAEAIALPYGMVAAGADPLEFAGHRTGAASHAPLLLLTAGEDAVLHPLLATHLTDALGMTPTGVEHQRRGPRSTAVQWPSLGHEMVDNPQVRAQAYDFIARQGRRATAGGAEPAPSASRVAELDNARSGR